ncbi:MAG: hypothetical protein Q8R92_16390 [Deltaproteobacteria bacterium]|nr:hypothetical protein [Deltaproteobacteria bacterium]
MRNLLTALGAIALATSLSGLSGCAYAKEVALKDIKKLPGSCKQSEYGPGTYLRKTEQGGRERRYIVHVPSGYRPDRQLPVIFFWHGGGSSPQGSRGWLGLEEMADQKGFLLVYPYGTGMMKRRLLGFNAGSCCGSAMKKNVDDVGFTVKMLDELEQTFCVDPRRVYSTGYSNGAMMSYRLACELSDRIAAIAPVGGTLGFIDCKPNRAVSLMHFHGTKDPYEPYAGGKGEKSFPGKRDKTVFRSVDDSVMTWVRIIGASPTPTSEMKQGSATRYVWGGGRNGSEVVLWRLEGGGHTWPGAKSMPLSFMLGDINRDVSANQLMWEFFMKHPLN